MGLGPKAESFRQQLASQAADDSGTQKDKPFDITEFRAGVDEFFKAQLSGVSLPKDVTRQDQIIIIDGLEVKLHIYKPKGANGSLPVTVFHPGGGLALDMANEQEHMCAAMCLASKGVVICVQPPLSPEHKFPEIFSAAYGATVHIYQNAASYNADPDKFYIAGYSMGGTVAALITNQSRSDGGIDIKGQVIISGVLDIGSLPTDQGEDFMFDVETHKQFVQMCLPSHLGIYDIAGNPQYSPVAADLRGLPKTVLLAGECDVFRKDTEKMARLLEEAGVDTKLKIIPGQIHNTPLLFPVMGDNTNPSSLAGKEVKAMASPKSIFRCCL